MKAIAGILEFGKRKGNIRKIWRERLSRGEKMATAFLNGFYRFAIPP